jgi:hypothetical protein
MKYKIKYYSRQRKDRTVVLYVADDWRFFDTDGIETNENRDVMIADEKVWVEGIMRSPEDYLGQPWIALIPCDGHSFNEIVPAIARGAFFRRKEWKNGDWARRSLNQSGQNAGDITQDIIYELFNIYEYNIVKVKDFVLSPKEIYMEDWIVSQPDLMLEPQNKKETAKEKESELVSVKTEQASVDTKTEHAYGEPKKDDWAVVPTPGEVIPERINGYYVHRKITDDMFIVRSTEQVKGTNFIVVNKDGKPYFDNWYDKIILLRIANQKRDIRFLVAKSYGSERHDMVVDKNERILFGKDIYVHLSVPQNNSSYMSVYDMSENFIGTYSIENNKYYASQPNKVNK